MTGSRPFSVGVEGEVRSRGVEGSDRGGKEGARMGDGSAVIVCFGAK